MRIAWTGICFILVLTGCQQPKSWYKEGATNQDFYMDSGQCKAQAFSVSQGSLLQIAIVQNACMQGKGWSLVSEGEPTEIPKQLSKQDLDIYYDFEMAKLAYADKNYYGAAQWYRKAADSGNAIAEYNMGLFYHNGWSVKKDEKRARFWLKYSADHGNEEAQKALEGAYAEDPLPLE